MPASFSSIRSAIKGALETIDGLHAYAEAPGQIVAPAAIVLPASPLINYDATMQRGSDDYQLVIRLLVNASVDDTSQTNLDAYLEPSGASSIKAAIDGDLGGVVDFARVARADNYGEYEYAGVTYLGVEFVVEVTA